ncbi:MAG: FHA domain-containing protein [Ilumatobacteraceae bacterium]|jgi:pSer/pThr/pTyr-binding forkhead associated (FHA) protein
MRTVTIAKVDALQDAPGVEDNISVTVDQSGKKKALLVVRNGPNEGARFSLSAIDSVIGRHPDSTICLDDVTVSRRHAHLEQSDGQVVLRDLGSLNGTYVNQERIEEVALRHGDEVQIGRYRMVFFESAS